MQTKDLGYFFLYFTLSTLLTWGFVVLCPLYISREQMLLSTSIAGGKWVLQIVLGLLLLKNKSGVFLRKIGGVCCIGSCILIPYILSAIFHIDNSAPFFFGSLIVSVLVMIFCYYKAVRSIPVSLGWWFFWLVCLTTAISLQLTVVFHFL